MAKNVSDALNVEDYISQEVYDSFTETSDILYFAADKARRANDKIWEFFKKKGDEIAHANKTLNISQFDRELLDYASGKLPKNHIFSLGTPGEILEKCGFPKNQRIELSASHLDFKSKLKWHPFELSDVYGLDKALQKPVAVFSYGDREKSQNVIVNLERDGKNFLAGIHFNQKSRGYEVSDMRTLFPKDNIDWLNWINQGKMIYGDKEKLQALLEQQRINVADVNNKNLEHSSQALTTQQRINVAEVSGQVVQSPLHEHCLESASSILQRFGDVKDIFTDGHAFYEEIRERSQIEQKFFAYYTEKGNLDARELSQYEAEEFYNAMKNGDKEKIREYTETDLHETAELAKEIYEKKNPQSQEKSVGSDSRDPLTKPMQIEVNGKIRDCPNGVLRGFKSAVETVDRLALENAELKKQQLQKYQTHKKSRSDGWER